MTAKHYKKYAEKHKEPLQLRDYLAIDRTLLANERSLLAYVRTAITLFIAGISLIKFFDSFLVKVLGEVFVAATILLFIQGVRRYKATEQMYEILNEVDPDTALDIPLGLNSRMARLNHAIAKLFYR